MKPSWLETVCPGEWDVLYLEKGGELQAFFPFRLRKKWGIHIVTTPFLTPHSGPWIRTNTSPKESIEALIGKLNKYEYVHLTLDPDIEDPIYWNQHFDITVEPTFSFSGTPDQLNQGMQKKLRQQLRQVQDQFKSISIASPEFIVPVKQSFKRRKSKLPFSLDLINRIEAYLKTYSAGKIIGALDEKDEILAAAMYYEDAATIYTILSGQNYDHDPRLSHKWLHHLILVYGLEQGKTIHFMGSKIKGVAYWNSYFGAPVTSYFRIKKHPLQRLSWLWRLLFRT